MKTIWQFFLPKQVIRNTGLRCDLPLIVCLLSAIHPLAPLSSHCIVCCWLIPARHLNTLWKSKEAVLRIIAVDKCKRKYIISTNVSPGYTTMATDLRIQRFVLFPDTVYVRYNCAEKVLSLAVVQSLAFCWYTTGIQHLHQMAITEHSNQIKCINLITFLIIARTPYFNRTLLSTKHLLPDLLSQG